MKTRCLVVDDEPLAQELICSYLRKLENFEIVGQCCDAIQALQMLRENQIDLIFLDIRLPRISGIELLKILKKPPKVIITTAFREHAIDCFELDVLDYLLKPFTFERFLKAINRYFEAVQGELPAPAAPASAAQPEEAFLYVKENKKVVKILLNEILYIEGLSEYVKIFAENKKIITKTSMTQMEERLPEDCFLRIHKSYIVALKKIEAFTATSVAIPGKELPIGRSYRNIVQNALHYGGKPGVN